MTVVGAVTKPTRMPRSELGNPVGATRTSPSELPAAITRESGSSGSNAGWLVLKVTTAPPAGAGPVRSTLPRASPPLNFSAGKVTELIRTGPTVGTVNEPVADHAVQAGSAPM